MIYYIAGAAILVVLLWFGKKFINGGTCTLTNRLDGKVVFITGANTGIGR